MSDEDVFDFEDEVCAWTWILCYFFRLLFARRSSVVCRPPSLAVVSAVVLSTLLVTLCCGLLHVFEAVCRALVCFCCPASPGQTAVNGLYRGIFLGRNSCVSCCSTSVFACFLSCFSLGGCCSSGSTCCFCREVRGLVFFRDAVMCVPISFQVMAVLCGFSFLLAFLYPGWCCGVCSSGSCT